MNSNKTAIIVGAGEFTNRGLDMPYDMAIAADAGLEHLLGNNICPDVIIGDYDSLGYVPKGSEVIELPVQKDMTDMDAAMRLAWERGCSNLNIYGASGGDRVDHFLGNLQLGAEFSRLGANVKIIAPTYSIYFITDQSIKLNAQEGAIFSVLSSTPVSEKVSIMGDVQYKLYETDLHNTGTLGISNQATGEVIEISVKKGTLMVLLNEESHQ